MEIIYQEKPEQNILAIEGEITYHHVTRLFRSLKKAVETASGSLKVDLSHVKMIDSAGVACFIQIHKMAKSRGVRVELFGLSTHLEKMFSVLPWKDLPEAKKQPLIPWIENIGDKTYALFGWLIEVLVLISDVFYWASFGPLRRRWPDIKSVIEQAVYIGADAVGIVGLTSFLVGMTLALLSSYQLRQFGANIFVANLVGVAMAREMGPLIAAIIVAGRSGAAIAAEIATMMVTEEIDALKTMGINPIRFIVIPKVWAITITQPLLTVMSDLFGILGGFMIGILALDLGTMAFINQLLKTLFLRDVVTGLIKSMAFAWIIVFVGTYKGFKVEGGAKGVGLVTTSSVVICLFSIIVTDAVFSLIFTFTE